MFSPTQNRGEINKNVYIYQRLCSLASPQSPIYDSQGKAETFPTWICSHPAPPYTHTQALYKCCIKRVFMHRYDLND